MFSITTHNMAAVRSYQAAASLFAHIEKPSAKIWGPDERPLDSPRMYHKRLDVTYTADGKVDSYGCYLYATCMVRYYTDGQVIINGDDRQSSRKFLDRTLPAGVSCFAHECRTWFQIDTPEGTVYVTPASDTILLAPAGRFRWRIVDGSALRKKRTLNCQKARELRAGLKGLVLWGQATAKLMPTPMKFHNKYRLDRFAQAITEFPPDKAKAILLDDPAQLQLFNAPDFWTQVYRAAGAYTETLVDFTTPP